MLVLPVIRRSAMVVAGEGTRKPLADGHDLKTSHDCKWVQFSLCISAHLKKNSPLKELNSWVFLLKTFFVKASFNVLHIHIT